MSASDCDRALICSGVTPGSCEVGKVAPLVGSILERPASGSNSSTLDANRTAGIGAGGFAFFALGSINWLGVPVYEKHSQLAIVNTESEGVALADEISKVCALRSGAVAGFFEGDRQKKEARQNLTLRHLLLAMFGALHARGSCSYHLLRLYVVL